MEQVTIIGIDVSKGRFQVQRATAKDQPVFHKKLLRDRLPGFLSEVAPRQIVMDACDGCQRRGRHVIALGHPCEPITPVWAKPFLHGQKIDIDDAAPFVDTAHHPTMRFEAVKSEPAQDDAVQNLRTAKGDRHQCRHREARLGVDADRPPMFLTAHRGRCLPITNPSSCEPAPALGSSRNNRLKSRSDSFRVGHHV